MTKDDIGRAKPTTHDLPSQEHAYGVKNRREQFGVDKLTNDWDIGKPSEVKQTKKDY